MPSKMILGSAWAPKLGRSSGRFIRCTSRKSNGNTVGESRNFGLDKFGDGYCPGLARKALQTNVIKDHTINLDLDNVTVRARIPSQIGLHRRPWPR